MYLKRDKEIRNKYIFKIIIGEIYHANIDIYVDVLRNAIDSSVKCVYGILTSRQRYTVEPLSPSPSKWYISRAWMVNFRILRPTLMLDAACYSTAVLFNYSRTLSLINRRCKLTGYIPWIWKSPWLIFRRVPVAPCSLEKTMFLSKWLLGAVHSSGSAHRRIISVHQTKQKIRPTFEN